MQDITKCLIKKGEFWGQETIFIAYTPIRRGICTSTINTFMAAFTKNSSFETRSL